MVVGAGVTGALVLALKGGRGTPAEPIPGPPAASTEELGGAFPRHDIAFPGAAMADLRVLTEMGDKELEPLLDTKTVVGLLEARHCGDATACDAVRAYVQDVAHVSIEALAPSMLRLPPDLDKAASGLTAAERAGLGKRRVILIHAGGPAQPKQLPLRAAFAVAGALAEKTGGFVFDDLVVRIEQPSEFLAHAVTAPLDASAFRNDRVDVQVATKDDGNVRLLTAGMERFGCPDLEIPEAYPRDAQDLADVLYAAASSLANGTKASPLALTRADLERVHGAPYARDAGMPPIVTVEVGVEDAKPLNGDPNDYMARLVTLDGTTAYAYDELASELFGERAPPPMEPTEESVRAAKEKVDKSLPDLLAKTKQGATLYLEFPFLVPPDPDELGEDASLPADAEGAEEEWMWIEVKSFDTKTVTGILMDSSERIPTLEQGQAITRKRADALDYQLKLPDGAVEGTP
jgi:hypothetical protein